MSWVRTDDRAAEHMKIREAGTDAYALWSAALGFCNRNLTDGRVEIRLLQDVWRPVGERFNARVAAAKLVAVGLWHPPGYRCESGLCPANSVLSFKLAAIEDAYVIHDYFEYQKSRTEILADRGNTAARVRKHRNRKLTADDCNGVTAPVTGGVTTGVSNSVSNATPDPDPDPDRSSSSAADGRTVTRDALGRLLANDWHWSIAGIPPKWDPLAGQLQPFSSAELEYARREAEGMPGKPNVGLLLRIVERVRAEGTAQARPSRTVKRAEAPSDPNRWEGILDDVRRT